MLEGADEAPSCSVEAICLSGQAAGLSVEAPDCFDEAICLSVEAFRCSLKTFC